MMISEMVKLFIDSRRRGTTGARKKCSPTTMKIYQANLNMFRSFLQSQAGDGGVENYTNLKRMHMVQFLDMLDKKLSDGELAKASCLQVLRTLRTFFRWVDKDDDCQEAGLKGMQKYLPAIEKNPRRTDIPQLSDLKTFKNNFNLEDRYHYRDYVATCLMIETGIRLGEVCNLRMENVLLQEFLIAVNGKTGPRALPITKDMVNLLKGWFKRRLTFKMAEDSPFVFISKYKPKMDVSGFGGKLRKHRIALGLPRITAHTMRHLMATNYLRQGGDIEKLRMMTGHTSYEMLREYLHLAKVGGKAMQEELEKVSLLKAL